jgi:WD40 repeat protein
MGRRFAAVAALAAAARIRPTLDVRNAAAAALALEDITLEQRWPAMRASINTPVAFDENLERYVVPQPDDRMSLRRLGDNVELASFPAPPSTDLVFSRNGRFLAGRVSESMTWIWTINDDPAVHPPTVVLKIPGAEWVSEMAFTPDDNVLAASVGRGELALYDLKVNPPNEIARWHGLPAVRGLRFDPTGQRLAVTSTADSVAEIRETVTGRLLQRLPHPAGINGVDWTPDGAELATAGQDFQIRIWSAATGTLLRVLEGHQNVVVRPLYHPEGQILATAGWDATLRFWSPNNGRLLFDGPPCHDWVRFSKDGTHLAIANYDGAVELYRVALSQAVRMFMPKDHEPAPRLYRWLDFSGDTQRFVSTGNECVHVWDVASGLEKARLPLPGATALTSIFTKDGDSVLVADANRGVSRWQISSSADSTKNGGLENWRTGEGWEMALRAPDGHIVLVNTMLGMTEIVSPNDPVGHRIGPHNGLDNVALSPDGKRIATGTWQGKDIMIWEIATGRLLTTLSVGESAFAFWPTDKTIISVQMTRATKWIEQSDGDWQRDQTWQPDPGQTFWVHASLTPDGRKLALPQSNDRIRLVEVGTGQELITLEPPKAFGLGFVRFSDNGQLLGACGSRGQVAIWDLPELRSELAKLGLDW